MDDERTTGTPPRLTQAMVLLFALSCGVSVANLYYAQPVLESIARTFGATSGTAGLIVTFAQIGYALGLAFLVPLGDLLSRRRLVPTVLVVTAVGLTVSALAPDIGVLVAVGLVVGGGSVAAQLLIPMAASLADDRSRGHVVGVVMSGLLLGILLARTVAGLLAELGSWRTVYWVGAAAMVLGAAVLRRVLPRHHEPVALSYPRLLLSIATLFRDEPVLRLRSMLGATCFAAFSVLWTSMGFLLAAPPYNFSPAGIGLFGLAGVAGALAASGAGRMVDRGRGRRVTGWGLWILLLSWGFLAFAGRSMAALVAGVLILDLAVQGLQITNQSTLYRIRPEARNRMTSGYMTSYFIGGATGSLVSASAYGWAGWMGVTAAGAGFSALALAIWACSSAKS